MTYLVLCTFDLKGATSTDYTKAYADLEAIGLTRVQKGTKSDVVIPTTTVMGDFNGLNSNTVRDDVRDKIRQAFKSRRFTSEIFVVVGENGTWGSATT